MAYWGLDDLDEELARVRALRAGGANLAEPGSARFETFGAALEQFEQLLRSAVLSPPATAPLPLFYALSQAGRAIAAARHPDEGRWQLRGHGLKGPRNSYPPQVGEAVIRTDTSPRGAFKCVSEATGSAWTESHGFALNDLWGSLPQIETTAGLGGSASKPIQPERQTSPDRAPWVFSAFVGTEDDPVEALKRLYPALAEDGIMFVIQDDARRPGWFRGGIFTPGGTRRLAEVAETYLSDELVYIRPSLRGTPGPSILMTWWATLFALSQLARYEPATWTNAITPDRSALAVPIESALRQAGRIMPRLVLHGLTGHWHGA